MIELLLFPNTECNQFFKLLIFNELQLSQIFGQQNGNKEIHFSAKHQQSIGKKI